MLSSGEWEVPVTRNAKITPVNEGVGAGSGGLPSGITLWQGPPLPVTLRLIHPPPKMTQGNDPPPKMTQGNDPPPKMTQGG
jgi:hypothetical protein